MPKKIKNANKRNHKWNRQNPFLPKEDREAIKRQLESMDDQVSQAHANNGQQENQY